MDEMSVVHSTNVTGWLEKGRAHLAFLSHITLYIYHIAVVGVCVSISPQLDS